MSKINIFSVGLESGKGVKKNAPLPLKDLKKTAEKILTFFKDEIFFLDIYLVDNQEMRRLNKKFRGKDRTTNVLSFKEPDGFPHPEITGIKNNGVVFNENASDYSYYRSILGKENKKSAKNFRYLGEVYLAPDYIKARNEDIHYLLIHGILHLFGYTHNDKNDTIRMIRRENKILRRLRSQII